jgi:hypothetical protein
MQSISEKNSSRPPFIGKGWLAPSQGFSYADILPAGILNRNHENEWLQLISIFEMLKEGRWTVCADLSNLALNACQLEITFLALKLMGYTCTTDQFSIIKKFFQHPIADIRIAAYESALYSCNTDFIDPLLLALRTTKSDEKLDIMSTISHLLETEPNDFYDDTEKTSQLEYEKLVLSQKIICQNQFDQNTAILESQPHNLLYLVERIEHLCHIENFHEFSGTISMYFDFFEAMTGWPTVGVFDVTVDVNKNNALNLMSSVRKSGILEKFITGERYFFGHQLPNI